MIIFTIKTNEIPEYLYIDRERFRVRAFKEKPLQCFKCFGFGHSAKICLKDQICGICSLQKHEGECTGPVSCINCKGYHSARYKECESYKIEIAAVEKAHAEHLSIGQAKRLLSIRPQYSSIVKDGGPNKDQAKKVSQIPKPQLSPSQLEIHPASQPSSSQKASLPPCHRGDLLASLEATRANIMPSGAFSKGSQAELLPDLGSSQKDTLIKNNYKAQVHDMETESLRHKRPLSPSSSPPKHTESGKPPKRGDSRSLEDIASSSSRTRPTISRQVNSSTGKPLKKPPKHK